MQYKCHRGDSRYDDNDYHADNDDDDDQCCSP